MSDPKYMNIGEPATCLVEECSELIQSCSYLIKIICKAQRFGYLNYHPDTPERTNIDHINAEIDDVMRRCVQMRQWMATAISIENKLDVALAGNKPHTPSPDDTTQSEGTESFKKGY